ncbi:MAG: pyridoxal phosphate-dependent aminotransferase [Chloroflexota bacterium]|nr:pyridoxal phosphate-dependent aminotransferase [Chloroflexota bacterium]
MGLARRVSRLGTETAFEVLAKARALEAQGKDIVHLEIGEPDFATPPHIVEAAVKALRDGYTHYGPSAGLPEVREAIVRNVNRWRGTSFKPHQVIVTPGAKPIMFYTLLAMAERGAEVVYPNPGFPIYESMIRFCGAKAVPLRLPEEKGYHPDLKDLALKVNERTRLIILNSPHNPAGSVMSREEVETVARLVLRYPDLYVLSDEVYKDILYEGEHFSIASVPGMEERTIILDGFSKSYAMTGWRLGYGVFPEPFLTPVTRLVTNSVSHASSFIQRAALAALEGPQDAVAQMREEFRARRDLMLAGLSRIPGVRCPKPEGAFYLLPNIAGTGLKSREFQELAMSEAGVALLSGASFGKYGEGYIRLSYANSRANLAKALERLERLVLGLAR